MKPNVSRLVGTDERTSEEIMTEQSLYSVLGLPPSATELDIRVAYLHKLARIRAGMLPSEDRPAIERAYATLENPDKRFRYDLHFAAYSRLPEKPLAVDRGAEVEPLRQTARFRVVTPRQDHAWRPMVMAAGASIMAVSLAVVLLLSGVGRHSSSHQVQMALGQPGSQNEAQVVEAKAAPEVSSDEDQQPEADAAADTLPNAPEAIASVPAAAPAQVRAPVVARVAAPVARVRQSAFITAAPEPVAAEVAAPDETVSYSTPAPVFAQSSPYGRSRSSFRLAGVYCHDSGGGEVYMPAGAPVPEGLSC
jgi:hypothetical protein